MKSEEGGLNKVEVGRSLGPSHSSLKNNLPEEQSRSFKIFKTGWDSISDYQMGVRKDKSLGEK